MSSSSHIRPIQQPNKHIRQAQQPNKPIRPLLPLLLLPVAAGWAGISLASELVYQGQRLPVLAVLIVALVCTGLGIRALLKGQAILSPLMRRRNIIVLVVIAFSLGFLQGTRYYGNLAGLMERSAELNGWQELIVIEDARVSGYSSGSTAELRFADGALARVRIYWNDASLEIFKGSQIRAVGIFTGLQSSQKWLFERGCIGTLNLTQVEVLGFPEDLAGAVDSFRCNNIKHIFDIQAGRTNAPASNGYALLVSILFGYRSQLAGSSLQQDFITTGLSHLVAVSGSHLVVVLALGRWFLNRLPLSRKTELLLLLGLLIFYVMLTGLQASAIRSAIMAGIASSSGIVGRRGHAPSALMAAALAMLLVYPANAYALGFWLSVCSVCAITLFTSLVTGWISAAAPLGSPSQPGALAQALAMTLVAMTATLPIAVPAFAVLSLVAPLANLLVAPLVSLALVVGMLAILLAVLVQPLGLLLMQLALIVCDIAAGSAKLLARIPWASVPLDLSLPLCLGLGFAVAALIYRFWPLPRARVLRASGLVGVAAVCLLVFCTQQLTSPRLVVMDIGQGDAILIQERGSTVLIDTGASEDLLVHALARNHVASLDAVIITHLDGDHVGALARLRGLVKVNNIYFASGLLEHQATNQYIQAAEAVAGAEHVHELSQGSRLSIGKTLSLIVLWPHAPAFEGSNAESFCLLLIYDADGDGRPEQQALLTGDCENQELSYILQDYPDLWVNILKVGHHGSRNALVAGQLEDLGCNLALISAGATNRYGHPAPETLALLEAAGVRILRTDELGDISCLFYGSQLKIRYAGMKDEFF